MGAGETRESGMRALKWLLLLSIGIAVVWWLVFREPPRPPTRADAAKLAVTPLPKDQADAQAPLLRAVKDWQAARFTASNDLVAAAVEATNARSAHAPESARQGALDSSLRYVRDLDTLSARAERVALAADVWRKQGHPGAVLLLEAMASSVRNDALEAASPPYSDNRLQDLPPHLSPDARFAATRSSIADHVETVLRLLPGPAGQRAGAPPGPEAMAAFQTRVLGRGPFGSHVASSDIGGSGTQSLYVVRCTTTVDLDEGAPPDEERALNLRRRESCEGAEDQETTTRLLLTSALSPDEMALDASGVAGSCRRGDGSACAMTRDTSPTSGRIALATDAVLVLELDTSGKPAFAVVTSR